MNRLATWVFRIALGSIVLSLIYTQILRIDALKFWAFERKCATASERIYLHQPFTEFAIDYQPWSGVIEDYYYPHHLAEELLKPNSLFKKVQLFYEMPRNKVVEASCAGKYVIEATQSNSIKIGACGKMVPASSVDKAEIVVKYNYGRENFADIRPFNISIINTRTGETLAEQKSFQLLLGGMSDLHNQVMYGWGSAQGARVCKLTKPSELLRNIARIPHNPG
ncbi:MAG: hypothetical protein EOO15_19270 [Chitinophagaceae bacterium]|nr:MAG: hypothetical protein EOO15_19270 [Chitinophagaceae bacterium]